MITIYSEELIINVYDYVDNTTAVGYNALNSDPLYGEKQSIVRTINILENLKLQIRYSSDIDIDYEEIFRSWLKDNDIIYYNRQIREGFKLYYNRPRYGV